MHKRGLRRHSKAGRAPLAAYNWSMLSRSRPVIAHSQFGSIRQGSARSDDVLRAGMQHIGLLTDGRC